MAAPRSDVDFDKIAELHLAGETIQKLASDFGVSRPTIIRRLRRAEVPVRSQSEAGFLRYRNRPGEGKRVTAAAHEAVRGKQQTIEHRRKYARARQANPPAMSVHEAMFAAWLDERNIPYVREMAVDKYNLDFAIAPVAVEILGGEWHGTRKKAAQHRSRTPEILNSGWALLLIWATPTCPLTPAAADYAISHLEAVRADPSLIGEYRVIRGDGQLLARARAEDYEATGIPPARKGSNTIG